MVLKASDQISLIDNTRNMVGIKLYIITLPGAIQKSNGLKVTCLMSLYFKSEEDTMKNEIPADIFLVD